MKMLTTDIIVYLMESFLDDFDKTQLMAISKKYYSLRSKFTFNNKINCKLATHLDYYNNFTSLIIEDVNIILPKKIKRLTFHWNFNKPIKDYIPKSVTHLTFDVNFNQSIKACIPNSVTHLTFGGYFNQPIEGCIPNSVTHLTFGYYFNQPIEGCIPNSVTHLTFYGKNKRELYEKNIPKSIKNVMFN